MCVGLTGTKHYTLGTIRWRSHTFQSKTLFVIIRVAHCVGIQLLLLLSSYSSLDKIVSLSDIELDRCASLYPGKHRSNLTPLSSPEQLWQLNYRRGFSPVLFWDRHRLACHHLTQILDYFHAYERELFTERTGRAVVLCLNRGHSGSRMIDVTRKRERSIP